MGGRERFCYIIKSLKEQCTFNLIYKILILGGITLKSNLRKCVAYVFSIILIFFTITSGTKVYASEENRNVYLSDLEWLYATHGDDTQSKTVQKTILLL